MKMEMEEIYKCCKFIVERIEKEIDSIDSDFYSEEMISQDKDNGLLFFQLKKIILKENDPLLKEEYLYILKRIIIAFKDLKNFQTVQFDLQSKNNIHYTKFYKEIFYIINYIINLIPVDDYKFSINSLYPAYINYKRLQQLIPIELPNNIRQNEGPIQPKEIIEMFRFFLLFILYRTFFFIFYNINIFIEVFLVDTFRHDKYLGLIAQQNLNLLYDIIHRPNMNNIFSNFWFDEKFKEIANVKYSNNIKDLLNFGMFLKEINDNFILFNEYYNINYCSLYFFLLFNYEDFHFLEVSSNKNNYQPFLMNFLNEILIGELFNEETPKNKNQLVTFKLFNFIHGKNYCSFYPSIYFEKFIVDVLIVKVNSDKDMNFPKNPLVYYTNRLKKYINLKNIIERFAIDWAEKQKLLDLIKEKLNNCINHIQVK